MSINHASSRILSIALGLAATIACSSSGGSTSSAPQGTERGPCTAEGDCDEGLVCLSGVCVDPESGSGGGSSAEGSSGSGSGGGPGEGGASSGQGGEGSGSGGTASGDGGQGSGDGGTTSMGGRDGNGGAMGGGTSDGGAAGTSDGGAGGAVDCVGAHPNVEGTSRTCDADACYCTSPFDTCFPARIAEACCETTPRCATDSGPAGVDCAGTHPIVGPPRTCEPGSCLCSDGSTIDVCLPSEVAEACCPPGIELDCVAATDG